MSKQEKRVNKIKEIKRNCQIESENYTLYINDNQEMIMIYAVLGSDSENYYNEYNIQERIYKDINGTNFPCNLINIDKLID